MTKTPTITGLTIIREALTARASQQAIIAKDCGLSTDRLETFAQGRADLPADILARVVKFIWNGFVEYNPQLDLLQPVPQPPPRSVGVPPPPLKIATLPFGSGSPLHGGPKPEIPPKPAQRRSGWA